MDGALTGGTIPQRSSEPEPVGLAVRGDREPHGPAASVRERTSEKFSPLESVPGRAGAPWPHPLDHVAGCFRTTTSPGQFPPSWGRCGSSRRSTSRTTASPAPSPNLSASLRLFTTCEFRGSSASRLVSLTLSDLPFPSALRRRLNNNSLSGPFPTSLSKIPQLSFL